MVDRALSKGGARTAGPALTKKKRAFLLQDHGSDVVNLMHRIKKSLDPGDTLHPGKIFA